MPSLKMSVRQKIGGLAILDGIVVYNITASVLQ